MKKYIVKRPIVAIPRMARIARSAAIVVKEQTYIEAVPAPSWGNILYEGKNVIYNAWWMIVYPAAFTALTVFGLNLFGDGLRDLLDPHTN